MKYEVRIGDRAFEVDVAGDRVRVGGRELTGSLETIPHGPLRRLIFAARSRTFAVTRLLDGWILHRGGVSWAVEVVDERAKALRKLAGGGTPPTVERSIRAPMPGLVIRIEVTEGQTVAAGTGLVVLEAMKMENEIRAPSPGIVRRLLVTQGQAVEKGAALVELDRQG